MRRVQRGTAGVEVLALGVLVLVFGTLLVANAWAVIDAKLAATAASREAVRAAVEAPDAGSAHEQGSAAAIAALRGMGRTSTPQVELSGEFGRCLRLVATVRLDVPAIILPGVTGHVGAFHVSASHSEVVDPFRSGLVGVAACG